MFLYSSFRYNETALNKMCQFLTYYDHQTYITYYELRGRLITQNNVNESRKSKIKKTVNIVDQRWIIVEHFNDCSELINVEQMLNCSTFIQRWSTLINVHQHQRWNWHVYLLSISTLIWHRRAKFSHSLMVTAHFYVSTAPVRCPEDILMSRS